MSDLPTNRLIEETSPYLLQHAHNPVDWYPWCEEALQKAKEEDKPILLSIGYSACHWCHVMERESFENADTAALMNDWFVCIKVDREERPDLDSLYMAATVAMNQGHGGWPMTVFLTPDQSPFFAGTYFPPQDLQGTPGFPRVLQALNKAWTNDRKALLEQSDDLVKYLKQESASKTLRSIGEPQIQQAIQNLYNSFDTTYGGFSPAPKFPAAASISLLLRFYHNTGNPHALKMADHTLSMMADGGIYDHIGGGFARYSVDEKWLVPHFEKMLYDNALLTRSYVEGWQVTQNPTYLDVVRETLDFTLREMTNPDGGFYSALDADSEGEEGKFYVWTPEQIRSALSSKDAELFCAAFDISEEGNFEGASIAHPVQTKTALADQFAMKPEEVAQSLRDSKSKLLEIRESRVRPGIDDKVITAWNGMMIGAMALGYQITQDKRYLDAASRAAGFIAEKLTQDGRLLRTWRSGRAQISAYLEDYAYLSEGLIELYEASGEITFLERAQVLAKQMVDLFSDPKGGAFYSTAHDQEKLLIRKKESKDGATPSDNAVAANVFARLAKHFHQESYREAAVGIIEGLGDDILKMPQVYSKTLQAADYLLSEPLEVVFCGPKSSPKAQELKQTLFATYFPQRVIAHQAPSATHPLLEGRESIDTETVLICHNYTCNEPADSVEKLENQLRNRLDNKVRKTTMATPIAGKASAEGTEALITKHQDINYRLLGSTTLHVSNLGYGSYRIDEENSDHAQSLQLALRSGFNIIETGTSYTNGSSERLIGRTLRRLIRNGSLSREQVVLVSKAGYLQGNTLKQMKARTTRNEEVPEIVEFSDKFWHCMHPEFLQEEIAGSLDRLGGETIDAYLLHNPEYFLLHANRVGGGTRPQLLEKFYARIEQAFSHLEIEVKNGRIQYYGISSNTITDSDALMPTLNLEKLLEIAEQVGGSGHHFQVVQCPLNLLEPQAALSKRESGKTILEIAQEANLGVLTNRPLNAILGGGLIRLSAPIEEAPTVMPAQNLLKLTAYEKKLREHLNVEISGRGETIEVGYFFRWAEEFNEMKEKFKNMVEWEDFLFGLINPRLNQSMQFLNQNLQGEYAETWKQAFPEYRQILENVCQDMRILALQRSHQEVSMMKNAMKEHVATENALSDTALTTAVSSAGVTSVLTGMRQPQYVEQAIQTSKRTLNTDSKDIYLSLESTARQFMRRNLNDDEEPSQIL